MITDYKIQLLSLDQTSPRNTYFKNIYFLIALLDIQFAKILKS